MIGPSWLGYGGMPLGLREGCLQGYEGMHSLNPSRYIPYTRVSRLSRAVSRCLAPVSRVSHRVYREFRGCLACVSRCVALFHGCESV